MYLSMYLYTYIVPSSTTILGDVPDQETPTHLRLHHKYIAELREREREKV